MKNYIVICTLNENHEVFATFHKVEELDPMAKAMLEVNVHNATELPTDQLAEDMSERVYPFATLQTNTIYVFQFDAFETPVEYNCSTHSESAEEHLMRILGFRKCDRCGAWVNPQDIRTGSSTWDGRTRLCQSCVALANQREETRRVITLNGYHDCHGRITQLCQAPSETWSMDNLPQITLGLEMEYSNGRNRHTSMTATEEFWRVANPRARTNRVFHCEQDCTVSGEIISNIMTKQFALNHFDWSILTNQLRANGNDESIASVGFHVHIGRQALGSTQKEQAINFLKLQYILKAYENDWIKVSGRRPSEMGYCSMFDMSTIESLKNTLEQTTEVADAMRVLPYGMSCSHGSALIMCDDRKTFELRIGKSTNDPEKIKYYLSLVIGVVENIKNIRFDKIYCMGKIFKLVPSETMNYWRKNGAFLNTIAQDSRGITTALRA